MANDSQNKDIRMEDDCHSIETSDTPTPASPTKQVLITKLVQLLNRQSLHNSGAETLDGDALTLLDAAIEDTKTDMEKLRKELNAAASHYSIRQPSEPGASKRRCVMATERAYLTSTTLPNPKGKGIEAQHPPTQERTHATPTCTQDMDTQEASAAPPFETHSWMIRPVYHDPSPDKPDEQHGDKVTRKEQQQHHQHQGIVEMRELERDLDLDARIEELERDLDACVEALERDLAVTGVS